MTYLDPNIIRPARLSDVKAPGLFVTSDSGGVKFLVADTLAIYLTGDSAGKAFEQNVGQDWEGVALEGLRLQIDPDSRLEADTEMPSLSVVRRNQGVFIWAKVKSQGFYQRTRVLIADGLPMGEAGREETFTRWRLVVGEGVDAVSVYEHQA